MSHQKYRCLICSENLYSVKEVAKHTASHDAMHAREKRLDKEWLSLLNRNTNHILNLKRFDKKSISNAFTKIVNSSGLVIKDFTIYESLMIFDGNSMKNRISLTIDSMSALPFGLKENPFKDADKLPDKGLHLIASDYYKFITFADSVLQNDSKNQKKLLAYICKFFDILKSEKIKNIKYSNRLNDEITLIEVEFTIDDKYPNFISKAKKYNDLRDQFFIKLNKIDDYREGYIKEAVLLESVSNLDLVKDLQSLSDVEEEIYKLNNKYNKIKNRIESKEISAKKAVLKESYLKAIEKEGSLDDLKKDLNMLVKDLQISDYHASLFKHKMPSQVIRDIINYPLLGNGIAIT